MSKVNIPTESQLRIVISGDSADVIAKLEETKRLREKMKTERQQKVYIPKKPRITTSNKEVQTVYFRGYSEEYDGDNYIVNRNIRKRGYLVSYACEHWCIGYEEPDFGEGNIATFCSFRSALNWVNKYGNIDCYGHVCHYFIESDKYVYTAFNILKPITRL